MATAASFRPARAPDTRFFVNSAWLMTAVMVAGFGLNFMMGRSSLSAPWYVHLHGMVFFGWVALYLAQNVLAASGAIGVHRKLGWLAAFWMIPMLVLGTTVTVAMAQRGGVPFFFQPQHFLIFDPLGLVFFMGLVIAAIRMRRRSDWHRRLQLCAMALLLGPGFGRLLPMPFLIPYAFEAAFVAGLLFPLAGVIADLRSKGRVHPAWVWGLGTCLAGYVAIQAVTYSPVGDALYAAAVAGTPGEKVPGLAYPPFPPGI